MELQLTADGSHTLYLPDMDEHYHSINGAIQESMHVYIESGLYYCRKREISVLEFGFGTGLNTLLTMIQSGERKLKIKYTSLEKYPLNPEILYQLNYTALLPEKFYRFFENIHACQWGKYTKLSDEFHLKKIETDFACFDFPRKYDVVYFDAFGPDKQPEVWTQEIFNSIFESMNRNGILTTYCAKGNVRRMMQSAGFKVERIPGPPGKREMLRAEKS